MKRSEIEKIVAMYLMKEFSFEKRKWYEIGEKVIDLVEKAGMIPPNQYASTNEFRFEWEDEDEKE